MLAKESAHKLAVLLEEEKVWMLVVQLAEMLVHKSVKELERLLAEMLAKAKV